MNAPPVDECNGSLPNEGRDIRWILRKDLQELASRPQLDALILGDNVDVNLLMQETALETPLVAIEDKAKGPAPVHA